MLITVVIGLSPLRNMRARSLAQDLREGAVEARGGGGGRTLQVIVAGQIAVTVTLLVGAALFSRSFAALARFDPGFEPDGVLSLRVQLPVVAGAQAGAPQGDTGGVQALSLLDDLRALPGVTHASLASGVPLAGAGAIFYSAEGMGAVDATNRPRAYVQRVSPGYVETLGLHLVAGRSFEPTDLGVDARNVMVTRGAGAAILAERECDWPAHQAGRSRRRRAVADHRRRAARRQPARHSAESDAATPTSSCRSTPRPRGFAVLLRTASDPSWPDPRRHRGAGPPRSRHRGVQRRSR